MVHVSLQRIKALLLRWYPQKTINRKVKKDRCIVVYKKSDNETKTGARAEVGLEPTTCGV